MHFSLYKRLLVNHCQTFLTKLFKYIFTLYSLWKGLYLHHKFVAALLNDLFGLQTRVVSAQDSIFVKYSLGIQHGIDGNSKEKNSGKEDVFVPGVSVLDLPLFFSMEQVRQTQIHPERKLY